MENVIPILSSSPPPLEDLSSAVQENGWAVDDDDFGDFVGPSVPESEHGPHTIATLPHSRAIEDKDESPEFADFSQANEISPTGNLPSQNMFNTSAGIPSYDKPSTLPLSETIDDAHELIQDGNSDFVFNHEDDFDTDFQAFTSSSICAMQSSAKEDRMPASESTTDSGLCSTDVSPAQHSVNLDEFNQVNCDSDDTTGDIARADVEVIDQDTCSNKSNVSDVCSDSIDVSSVHSICSDANDSPSIQLAETAGYQDSCTHESTITAFGEETQSNHSASDGFQSLTVDMNGDNGTLNHSQGELHQNSDSIYNVLESPSNDSEQRLSTCSKLDASSVSEVNCHKERTSEIVDSSEIPSNIPVVDALSRGTVLPSESHDEADINGSGTLKDELDPECNDENISSDEKVDNIRDAAELKLSDSDNSNISDNDSIDNNAEDSDRIVDSDFKLEYNENETLTFRISECLDDDDDLDDKSFANFVSSDNLGTSSDSHQNKSDENWADFASNSGANVASTTVAQNLSKEQQTTSAIDTTKTEESDDDFADFSEFQEPGSATRSTEGYGSHKLASASSSTSGASVKSQPQSGKVVGVLSRCFPDNDCKFAVDHPGLLEDSEALSIGQEPASDKSDERGTKQCSTNSDELYVWCDLSDLEKAKALAYHFSESAGNNKLFSTLRIDRRNVIMVGHRKQQVPLFAANLGTGVLEPTRGPVHSTLSQEAVATLVDTTKVDSQPSPSEDLPPAQFDWNSSGLRNPLESSESTYLDLDVFLANDAKPIVTSSKVFKAELLGVSDSSRGVSKSSLQPLENVLRMADMKNTTTMLPERREEKLSSEASRVLADCSNAFQAGAMKRKREDPSIGRSPAYTEDTRQSILSMSMFKLNTSPIKPVEPSLRRSVLIFNTLKFIERDLLSEGIVSSTPAPSLESSVIRAESLLDTFHSLDTGVSLGLEHHNCNTQSLLLNTSPDLVKSACSNKSLLPVSIKGAIDSLSSAYSAQSIIMNEAIPNIDLNSNLTSAFPQAANHGLTKLDELFSDLDFSSLHDWDPFSHLMNTNKLTPLTPLSADDIIHSFTSTAGSVLSETLCPLVNVQCSKADLHCDDKELLAQVLVGT